MNDRIIISVAHFNAFLEDAFNAGYDVGTLISIANKRNTKQITPEMSKESTLNMLFSENGLILFERNDYDRLRKHCYDRGVACAMAAESVG